MVYRVFVEKRQGLAQEAESLCGELRNFLGLTDLTGVRMLNRYDAEGLTAEVFDRAVRTVAAMPALRWSTYRVSLISGRIPRHSASS